MPQRSPLFSGLLVSLLLVPASSVAKGSPRQRPTRPPEATGSEGRAGTHKPCGESEIIERACAGPPIRPAAGHTLDPATGLYSTLAAILTSVRSALGGIFPTGAGERIASVRVRAEIQEAGDIEGSADSYRARLKQSWHGEATDSANASYNPALETIYVTAGLERVARAGGVGAAFLTLAHETGHHLDSRHARYSAWIKMPPFEVLQRDRAGIAGASAMKCAAETGLIDRRTAIEDWADWVGAAAVNHHLKSIPAARRAPFVRSAVSRWCEKLREDVRQPLFDVWNRQERDPHDFPRKRLGNFLRQPHVREALGCFPASAGRGELVSACSSFVH